MLTVAVLGPVELRRGGALLAVPGGETTGMLIRPAPDAGVRVRADRAMEHLWPAHAGCTFAVDVPRADAPGPPRTAESATALRRAGDIHAVPGTCPRTPVPNLRAELS